MGGIYFCSFLWWSTTESSTLHAVLCDESTSGEGVYSWAELPLTPFGLKKHPKRSGTCVYVRGVIPFVLTCAYAHMRVHEHVLTVCVRAPMSIRAHASSPTHTWLFVMFKKVLLGAILTRWVPRYFRSHSIFFVRAIDAYRYYGSLQRSSLSVGEIIIFFVP